MTPAARTLVRRIGCWFTFHTCTVSRYTNCYRIGNTDAARASPLDYGAYGVLDVVLA